MIAVLNEWVLNEDTRDILGRPCFACAGIAKVLRLDGHIIETRAEDEQAAVLHWLLGLYFEHGPDWRDRATAEVQRIKDTLPKGD